MTSSSQADTPVTSAPEIPVESEFGCLTGDCPHDTQAQCDAAIRAELIELLRERRETRNAAPLCRWCEKPMNLARPDGVWLCANLECVPMDFTIQQQAGEIASLNTALTERERELEEARRWDVRAVLARVTEEKETLVRAQRFDRAADARDLERHLQAVLHQLDAEKNARAALGEGH